jgi:putative toxin-antitoxin system antitoxin component (TIGR02293 family)
MTSQAERRADVYRLATTVLGGIEEAEAWMSQPAIGLDSQIPADLIETSKGAELVETYLMQIEYGVYV